LLERNWFVSPVISGNQTSGGRGSWRAMTSQPTT